MDTSEVSRLNRDGSAVWDEDGAQLLSWALQHSQETDGAFDITIAPLVELWGITSDSPRVPSQAEIDALLPLVGYEHVHQSEFCSISLDEGCSVDLGGLTAMLVMIFLRRLPKLSVYGVSIGGAAAHNIGQMAAAVITLGSTMVLGYLPFLLAVSLFTGALTGFITALLLRATRHIRFH